MSMLEEAFRKVKANCTRTNAARTGGDIRWANETLNSIVSTCGTYRISRLEDPENPGCIGFGVYLCPTPKTPAKFIAGPLPPAQGRQGRGAAPPQRRADAGGARMKARVYTGTLNASDGQIVGRFVTYEVAKNLQSQVDYLMEALSMVRQAETLGEARGIATDSALGHRMATEAGGSVN